MPVFVILLLAAGGSTAVAMFLAFAHGRMVEDPEAFTVNQKRFALWGAACFQVLQALCWAAAGYQIGGVL